MMDSIEKIHDECVGCGSCYMICPANSIKMEYNKMGFLYPVVNNTKCIGCGKCIKSCPVSVTSSRNDIKLMYGGAYKNSEIVKESSSGGAFYLFAEKIINKGGYVSGVTIDDKFHVKHILIDKIEDVYRLMGSKYVQSDIGDIYKEIGKLLNEENYILFSGTPCQCAGLISYLKGSCNRKMDRYLFTVEFICHGVPSPIIWEDYIKWKQMIYGGERINNINFRNKKYGWHDFGLSYEIDNQKYFSKLRDDIYYNGFIENLFLRESCYKCKFKGIKSVADISIADFWGSEKYAPELAQHYEMGTSLITIFSMKGKQLFESSKEMFDYVMIDNMEAYKSNTAAIISAKRNIKTKDFYRYREKYGTIAALNKFGKYTFKKKLRNKIKWKVKDILEK